MRPQLAPSLALALVAWSCSKPATLGSGGAASHALAFGSAPAAASPIFRVEPHHGGTAAGMQITGMWWGRLVDVHARAASDPARSASDDGSVLVARGVVVGEDVRSDGRDYLLESDPITAIETVTILHAPGTPAFRAAWERIDAGLSPVIEKSLAVDELPPFTTIPRNAAIVVRFDDLLDPATITANAIDVWTGSPVSERFLARVIADPIHGGFADRDGDGRAEAYPTRVIVDTTVSELDALSSPSALPVNAIGLPAGGSESAASAALRISTGVDPAAGRVQPLANLAGHGAHGATGTATSDVVRAFRAGGDCDVSQGLVIDLQKPRVVGDQDVVITSVLPDPAGGPADVLVNLTFAAVSCAQAATPRDVIQASGAMAQVLHASGAPVAGSLTGVRARVVAGGPLVPGPARFLSPWDPIADAGNAACFVRITPAPAVPPGTGVSPSAQVSVRFSEPMDSSSMTALDAFTLARTSAPTSPSQYVAGRMHHAPAIDEFTLVPLLPLDHAAGGTETYFATLAAGPNGPTDAAGNPLLHALPQTSFSLDPTAPALPTGSYVLRFESADEDGNGNPEIRGQFLHDFTQGEIRARPVTRFSAIADRTQPVPGFMPAFAPGVHTPLSPYGSKLHALWRYCDVGMALQDEQFTNVDVEGLAWSPVGGSVIADQYPLFEISLAHAKWLPDESLNHTTLLPSYAFSGLVTTYAQNSLDPLKVVHPRAAGYTVNPADAFVAPTGTPMMPWPLNRNLPPDQHRFYTWRDTGLAGTGGANNAGAELAIVATVLGLPPNSVGTPYSSGQVPTIGLPLLMEFKCFPNAGSLGLNSFDVSLAVNSSARPNLRAFSTGGINSAGVPVIKDPDLQTVATGGFNPSSLPPGIPTLPADNVFHIGQMDLVVRVSRLHSVWIDTLSLNPAYATPVFEPRTEDQPAGSRVQLAFRGATFAPVAALSNAGVLGPYGETLPPVPPVTYLNNDSTWKREPADLNGARYLQVRATLIANAATGEVPRLSGLGLSFVKP